MKRLLSFLFCLLMLFGCACAKQDVYRHPDFTASLPEPFKPVDSVSMVCFAPYGDPLLSSSITYYVTEPNWYFDSFTKDDYEESLKTLCQYESLTVTDAHACRVDGFDAYRISCKVLLEQGTHDLILYAVNGGKTYFFTLFNREGDNYIEAFDAMMSTLHVTEEQ